MKERPILFSAPMVRAILAGNKTMTRRVCRGQRERSCIHDFQLDLCPYGQPGDRLWVRETWRTDSSLDAKSPRDFCSWPVQYLADGAARTCGALYGNTHGKTRASIHMPRWASRITLEVTGVRVERLAAISGDDAFAEGIDTEGDAFIEGENLQSAGSPVSPERYAFATLWRSINGAGSWAANPWVWVVEFSRINPPSGSE